MSDWRIVRLGDAIEAKYGKALPQARRNGGEVPVYGSNGIVGWHDHAITSGPTIVIGRKGSFGEVNISKVPCWPIDTTYFIDDPGPYDLVFLGYLLRTLGLTGLDQSTAIPGLSRDQLYDIEVPVPTKEEQARISQLITTAREKQTKSIDHLKVARRAMRRFRQAVLAAACSGRLTVGWREEHDLPSVSTKLDRLRADRTSRVGRRNIVHTPEIDQLDTIPDTWGWATVGEVAEVKVGGTPSRKTTAYWNGGLPWVSSGEVANCRIARTRETISEAGLAHSNAKTYPAGTVLIAMIGEGKTRGQSAILDIEASTNQNVAGILPDPFIVSSEYVWHWALAQYEVTRAVGRGGNQPALNGQKVRELTIPVPPLEEQYEIVRRMDRFLAAAEILLGRVTAAQRQIERSIPVILAKAFRGELIPTEAEQKPAEVTH